MSKTPEKEPSTEDKARERMLEADLDRDRLPHHIAVIPDGNGRWARAHGWSDRVKGHEAGVSAIQQLVEECARMHIGALSIYAFSRDNWSRPKHETLTLMRFFKKFLVGERPRLMDNEIRLMHSGCREDLPDDVNETLQKTLDMTAANGGMVLNLAVSYSGREEIANAARHLAKRVAQGDMQPEDITPDMMGRQLYHPELGDPDVLIRTSGENRISDFLLYQCSYAELVFLPVFWPDFSRVHLLEALLEYQRRDRRFGGVTT